MRSTTLLAVMVAVSAAGCSRPFLYVPRGAVTAGPRVPAKVAVMPFADGTEDFVERIVYGKERRWNLAKKGFVDKIGALPPELWSKALADELAASGRFRSARFAYATSDLAGEDYAIEGTLLKAYGPPGEWALSLRAVRLKDGRQVWERQVSRTFERWDMHQLHPWLNRAMQEMFEEAGADLARTIDGGASRPVTPASADEPVETLMRRIGEGT